MLTVVGTENEPKFQGNYLYSVCFATVGDAFGKSIVDWTSNSSMTRTSFRQSVGQIFDNLNETGKKKLMDNGPKLFKDKLFEESREKFDFIAMFVPEKLYLHAPIKSQEHVKFLREIINNAWDALLTLSPEERSKVSDFFKYSAKLRKDIKMNTTLQSGEWTKLLSVVGRVLKEVTAIFGGEKNYVAALNQCNDFVEVQKHISTQTTALKEGKEKWAKIQNKLECAFCSKLDSRLKICGRCRQVAYCGQEHQKAHWPVHKTNCKKKIQKNT